ncbi:RNA polymerase sigma factor [Actinoplanes sp. NPDC051513]|uniref:RNA polymerase sigma factor n=1 Tax=Actinoplanes sp. NPDC051513 TaxID=3363908 RepID=UPI0037B2E5CF
MKSIVVHSDETLLAGMASGDPMAMAVFVRRYQSRVYGLALRVTQDAGLAEEVAQDAFMRAWRYATSYDARRGRAGTWLLTIARNVSVDAARLRRDCPVAPERLAGELAVDTDEPDHERIELLRDGLRSLPAGQARAIVLATAYGLTAREIAEREDIPLGTAKTRIRRGLARLRLVLGADTDAG